MSSDSSSVDPVVPLSPNYTLWKPAPGRTVATGADAEQVELPAIPLPLLNETLAEGEPTDTAIGNSIYDYLRQFPDCPLNQDYAALLRDVWPHYIADLASHAIMLDHKVVDAPYIKRKIVNLQILLLLSPNNSGLLLQLGLASLDLGMMFSELEECRMVLLQAMDYFQRVQKIQHAEPASLNGLARIDYLLGDYPSARRRWQALLPLLQDMQTREALSARLVQMTDENLPDHPLIDDLEAIGTAMRLLVNNGEEEAREILERLYAAGLTEELPSPEFFTLLAVSRERTGDADGAQMAFSQALELDPDFKQAAEGLERLIGKG